MIKLSDYRYLLEGKRNWAKRKKSLIQNKMKNILFEAKNNFVAIGEIEGLREAYKKTRDNFFIYGGSLIELQSDKLPRTIREKSCPGMYYKVMGEKND